MARPTVWRRATYQLVSPGMVVQHSVRAIQVFAGETVGRMYLHYQAHAVPAIAWANWGIEGQIGIRLQNDLSDVPTVTLPDDLESDEWMWVEGFGWKQEVFTYEPPDNTRRELISGPQDAGYRDIKAKRQCLSDGILWVQDAAVLGGGNQGNHYLTFTLSALIILPAV